MASFSRIVFVMVVVALSLLGQDGVLSFRTRKLGTLLKTSHAQQQEASRAAANSAFPSFAVSSEQIKKERVRLDFLNSAKMNSLMSAKQSADEAASLIQYNHRERLSTDESMWSSLTSDQVQSGFKLSHPNVVMPQKWQLLEAGIHHAALRDSSPHTVELELSTEASLNERIDAFLKGSMCWKSTTQRGIGTIPNSCTDPSHPSMDAGLCYKSCNANEHGVATMCIKNNCDPGYTDFGLTCTYTAGPLLVGKGCCCTVFGCCNVKCANGYEDDGGCFCRAITYGIEWDRGVGLIPTGCPSGRTIEAGLCYNQCPANYVGLATTCWEKCSGSTPVDCGAACASDTATCVSDIVDMVTGPLTIVLNVVTGGELGTALKSVGTVAMDALEDGVKAMVKAAADRMAELAAKNLSIDGVKATIQNMVSKIPSNLQAAATQQIFSAAQQTYEGHDASADYSAIASIDPTGIASTILAFAKPLC